MNSILYVLDVDDSTLKRILITHSSESVITLSFDDSIFLVTESNSSISLSSRSTDPSINITSYLTALRSASYLNQRIIPTDNPSESIELLVTDSQNGVSELHTTLVCFADIDTPPHLDLNGPDLPTTNFNTTYYENSPPLEVQLTYTPSCILYYNNVKFM